MKPEIEPYPTFRAGDKVVFKSRADDTRGRIHCIEKLIDHNYISPTSGERHIALKLVGRKKEVFYKRVRLICPV